MSLSLAARIRGYNRGVRSIVIAFTLSLSFAPALAFADEPPPKQDKKKTEKTEKSEKSKGCSIDAESNGVLGLAALVLLVSAAALRRRE